MTKACLLAALAGWALAWATDARSAMVERPAQTFVRLKGWMVLECPARQEGPSEECIVRGEPLDSKTACEIERARTVGAAKGTRLECDFVDQLVEVR